MVEPLSEKLKMIDRNDNSLSVSAQCRLLNIARSNLYYTPADESEENLLIMRFLDEQYFKTPFYGARKLTELLRQEGFIINKKRIKRLMKKINWQTIYRGPHTSIANKDHKVYPYLLRNLTINKVNQVWSTDITYIPMPRGYMYLCAIIDVHTRFVVGWSLSNTMTAEWCLSILQQAVMKHGKPQIINTDQGSQFTSDVFTQWIIKNEIKLSMDGKGRALDNIWIERLWRSVKYEDVYLKNYCTVPELEVGLKKYFTFYNQKRIHETLNYKTPEKLYKQAA